MHVYQPDYEQMKYLLAYAKEKDAWLKHWVNAAFTTKNPDKRNSQGVKTKYIQIFQTHRSIQLGMGAASIEGMINVNTPFDHKLLPGVDRKQ
jgi:hypothetical protein